MGLTGVALLTFSPRRVGRVDRYSHGVARAVTSQDELQRDYVSDCTSRKTSCLNWLALSSLNSSSLILFPFASLRGGHGLRASRTASQARPATKAMRNVPSAASAAGWATKVVLAVMAVVVRFGVGVLVCRAVVFAWGQEVEKLLACLAGSAGAGSWELA